MNADYVYYIGISLLFIGVLGLVEFVEVGDDEVAVFWGDVAEGLGCGDGDRLVGL